MGVKSAEISPRDLVSLELLVKHGSMNASDSIAELGRLVGVDYGTVRVGLAICDPERRWVSPLTVHQRRDRRSDADFYRQLVQAERVVGFVVGLPVHLSGEESEKSREARVYGEWLRQETQRPVVYFDERFSSREAESLLQERGRLTHKKKRQRLDAVAAQVMLQAFLESRSAPSDSPLDHNPWQSLD